MGEKSKEKSCSSYRYAAEDLALPKPWRALVDGNTGYIYFWNPLTNVTQYEKPKPADLPTHNPNPKSVVEEEHNPNPNPHPKSATEEEHNPNPNSVVEEAHMFIMRTLRSVRYISQLSES